MEGQNFVIEYRSADSQVERFADLATGSPTPKPSPRRPFLMAFDLLYRDARGLNQAL